MSKVSKLPVGHAMTVMAIASGAAAAIWSVAFLVPLPDSPFSAPRIAVACTALASLLTLLLMIESVAHERLVTAAFDPLAQRETERLKINQRVLQNTLEQLPLFAAGLAMIVWLLSKELACRATIAATAVWVLSRWTFWIGYHIAPHHRVAGLIGSAQSIIILLGAFALLGWRLAGPIGAALVPSLFSIGELIIVAGVRRR